MFPDGVRKPTTTSAAVGAASTPSAKTRAGTSRLTATTLTGLGELRLRLGHDPDVRLRRVPLTEDLLCIIVRDGAGDDHVVALLPVDRRRNLVVRGQLERVEHAEHLVEVAA